MDVEKIVTRSYIPNSSVFVILYVIPAPFEIVISSSNTCNSRRNSLWDNLDDPNVKLGASDCGGTCSLHDLLSRVILLFSVRYFPGTTMGQ